MKLGEALISYIEYGKKGGNKGLSFGYLPKLRSVIPNVQRGKIYTILGGTGAGKSIIGVHNFGFECLLDYHKNYKSNTDLKFHWFLNSLEMDLETLLVRFTSYMLLRDYGKVISTDMVTHTDGKVLPEDAENIIRTDIAPLLDAVSENITIYHQMTVGKIKQILFDYYGKHGTFERDVYGDINGYKTDKTLFVLMTVDHVALLTGDGSTKSKIDELAGLEIGMTTLFKTTFVNLQQLNRQEGDIQKILKMSTPKPALHEAKDSGTLIDASHVVIAPFHPNRFDIRSYLDLDISVTELGFRDSYRAVYVLKQRSGRLGMVHIAFYGIAGFIRELPELNQITETLKRKIRQSIPFWK